MRTIKKPNIKSVFYRNLASYLVVLSISLFIGNILYGKFKATIEDEALRANMAVLERACNLIDSQMKQIADLINTVEANQRIHGIMYTNPPLNDQTLYNTALTLDEMASYRSMYPLIHDFFIYFKNNDILLNSTSKYKPELFFEYVYNPRNISTAEWLESMVNSYHSNADVFLQTFNLQSMEKDMIVAMQSLPMGERNKPTATIAVLIDEEKVKALLDNLKFLNNGYIYIVDKNGKILVSNSARSSLHGSVVQGLSGEKGWFRTEVDGRDSAVSYIASQYRGWKYISVMPADVYMFRVTHLEEFTMLAAIIFVLVGIVTSYALAYRNYYPVKKIVKTIALRYKNASSDLNEFEYIQNNIDMTLEEEKRIHTILNEQRPIIYNNLLLRILKGRMSCSAYEKSYLESFNLEFPFKDFAVLAFYVGDPNLHAGAGSEEEWTFMRLSISDYAGRLTSTDYRAYTVETDRNKLVMLLNIQCFQQEKQKESIELFVKLICDFTSNTLDSYSIAGIGSIYEGINNVSKSYTEASRALDYGMTKDGIQAAWYGDIARYDHRYYYPVAIEQQILNCIKAGDFGKIEKLIDYVFDENLVKRNLSEQMLQFLIFDLINTIIKVMDELQINHKSIFGMDSNPVESLMACKTTGTMHKHLKDIIRAICSYVDNNKKSHKTLLTEKLAGYLQQEYGNPEISLTLISGKFNLTPQYLCGFFKEQTGENLMDYLNKLRIAKAKELLCSSNLSVDRIARNVGYNNNIALTRIFKRYMGITPGAYRDYTQSNSDINAAL